MAKRNGYFRLLILENGTYLELLPPEDGGSAISFDELKEYLSVRGHEVDKLAIAKVLENSQGEKCTIKLDDKTGYGESESYVLKISDDKMRCIARFYPCSNAAASLTIDEIIKDLKFKNINYGIREDVISAYLSDRHYCADYLIAEGKPVKEGTDGSLDYLFDTNPNKKPKLNEDGSVDFFNLSLITPCEAGQVLAKITPAIPGESGTNIMGEEVKPREVKQPKFKYGKGIKVSEDGLKLITETSGNVALVDDKIFVSNVYEVNDVDVATGNIEYDGDVLVLGSVRTGYCVEATGNVEVRGVVEGAMIQADGNVIISRGMNGMGKGMIVAKGNVVSKFIENSKVRAEGYIHSEAILHSEIQSKQDVIVTGKKGFITGGSVQALGNVEAKTIGSSMGVDTDIQVGTDPQLKLKANSLQAEISENTKKLDQIKPILATMTMRMKKGDKLTDNQIRTLKEMTVQYKQLTDLLERKMNEYEEFVSSVDLSETESVIKVHEYAYPGTKMTISEVFMQLKSPAQHSRFVKDGADIRIKAL